MASKDVRAESVKVCDFTEIQRVHRAVDGSTYGGTLMSGCKLWGTDDIFSYVTQPPRDIV